MNIKIKYARVSISPTQIAYMSNYFQVKPEYVLFVQYHKDYSFDIFQKGVHLPIFKGKGLNESNMKKNILQKLKDLGVNESCVIGCL